MTAPIRPLPITAHTATSALGQGLEAHATAIRKRRSGLIRNNFTRVPLECAIGRVAGIEDIVLPQEFAQHDCRNNRLAWMGLLGDDFLAAAKACIERRGADRVGLIVGTSTASIGATEEAYRHLEDGRFPTRLRAPNLHTPHSLGLFLGEVLGTRGPCLSVATACSSSARIFAKAERLIRLGICDAVILAGVDTLCDSVLFGFNALELVSKTPCRPFDLARDGISIGEAAGFALMERETEEVCPFLAGYGESSDAYHMSTPHPEGLGAHLAMTHALARAGRRPEDVDYVNLHGTATPKNDDVEAGVIVELFPLATRASSTKGWTGHTLGAAGILESVLTLIAMQESLVPGTLNCETPDPSWAAHIALENEMRDINVALSNSFGFGGSNCSLVFTRDAA